MPLQRADPNMFIPLRLIFYVVTELPVDLLVYGVTKDLWFKLPF